MNQTLNNTVYILEQASESGGGDLSWLTNMISTILPTILLFTFYFYGDRIFGFFSDLRAKLFLWKLARKYNGNVVFLHHKNQGLFSGMIQGSTLKKLRSIFQKVKGDVYLIIHSPGGAVFHSMRIANLIRKYNRGRVTAVIPSYAMSGASLLTLACDEIAINPTACLGVIDPQLGYLWKSFSSKSWDEILERKGDDAEDESIAMSYTGRQVTQSLKKEIKKLLKGKVEEGKMNEFVDLLTSGKVEHIYQINPMELMNYLTNVKLLKEPLVNKLLMKPPYKEVSAHCVKKRGGY